LVEIGHAPYVPVCFIDCVEEIGRHDDDVDAPSVEEVSRGARFGLGVSSAYGNSVVDVLDPSCYQLEGMSVCFHLRFTSKIGGSAHAWEKSPSREGEDIAKHRDGEEHCGECTQEVPFIKANSIKEVLSPPARK
jgi:hypothetical protein